MDQSSPDQKISIKLTDEQREALTAAFGAETVQRINEIEVEKIAGYVAATIRVN